MQNRRSVKIAFFAFFMLSVTFSAYPSATEALKEDISDNLKNISMTMTYYYKDPNLDRAIEAIKMTLQETAFIEDQIHADAVAHFFAAALQADKSRVNDLKAMMAGATESQKKFLTAIIDEAKDFRSPGMNDPQDMDFAWSEFLATGKEEPVKRIIKTLSYAPESIDISTPYWKKQGVDSKHMAFVMMQGTAEWSLASNATQHDRVKDIITGEIKTAGDEKLKKRLQNIIARSGPNPSK